MTRLRNEKTCKFPIVRTRIYGYLNVLYIVIVSSKINCICIINIVIRLGICLLVGICIVDSV